MFFSRSKLFHTLPRRTYLKRLDVSMNPYFSTSIRQEQLNNEIMSNKLIPQEIFSQVPTKLFTQRAEEETIMVEGVGWAGQPIVKRLHPILPEVHGDVSDIFTAVKKVKTISEDDSKLEIQVKNFGRSHDVIAVIDENSKSTINGNSNIAETRKRPLHSKRHRIFPQPSGIVLKKSRKKKKRTVVLAPKPSELQNSVKIKGYKKKNPKIRNKFRIDQNKKVQAYNVLSRRSYSQIKPRYFFHVENRQFKTFSALDYPAKAVAKQSKKEKSAKENSENVNPADDCVCPEILYATGKRKNTKICGSASGDGEKKKKSSWKQKMCPAEGKHEQERRKTLVCVSQHEKEKKHKRNFPKCPKPEKKEAPRVVICEPNLEEELEKKSKKVCVKQEEEVKIRKKTKVCKPVIIFAKEEAGVKIEKKATCSSTRVKKVVSRHTTICLPPEEK